MLPRLLPAFTHRTASPVQLHRACTSVLCHAAKTQLVRSSPALRHNSTQSSDNKPLSPLGKHIKDTILATGPISLAQYMQLALTSPIGGYYTQGQVFGRSGDFVTSPEISQMFGEIMAIWYVYHWEQIGKPQKTVLVELGPGRGTLMDDILRASARFPRFFSTITSINFVERSPELRKTQHNKLKCDSAKTAYINDKSDDGKTPAESVSTAYGNIPVFWHDHVEQVSICEGVRPLVMAHEFFDALPIYKFEKTGNGWCEILVDAKESSVAQVESPSAASTKATGAALESSDFKFVRSRGHTSNTAMALRDERFKRLFESGDQIEVSPESARIMIHVAEWIAQHGGMGLVIDYGQDWTQGATFRGIRNHKFVNPLDAPGSMDLTADVDFSYLRHAVQGKVKCFGPVEQGLFLNSMGIQARMQQIVQMPQKALASDRRNIIESYRRLVDPHSMGRVYKVMAIMPNEFDKIPVPFDTYGEDPNTPNITKIVK